MIKKGKEYAVNISLDVPGIVLNGKGAEPSTGAVCLEPVNDPRAAFWEIKLAAYANGRCLQSSWRQSARNIIRSLVHDIGNHSLWYLGIDSIGHLTATRPPSENKRQMRDFRMPAGRCIPGEIR